MSKTDWIHVRVTSEFKQRLQARADAENRPLANFVLHVVTQYLGHTEKKTPANPSTEHMVKEAKTRHMVKAAGEGVSVHPNRGPEVRVIKERKSNGKVHKH